MNSSRVISPFSIRSFASASVCARLETRSSSIVTGLLSGSAIVLPHLITLSALTSTFGGIVRPICFAVFRLITNSNFVGRSTGSQQAWCLSVSCPRNRRRAGTCPEVRPVDHEPTGFYNSLRLSYIDGNRLFNARPAICFRLACISGPPPGT